MEPQTLWLTSPSYRRSEATPPTSERPVARYLLMAVALVFLAVFLLLPLIVFDQEPSKGFGHLVETLAICASTRRKA